MLKNIANHHTGIIATHYDRWEKKCNQQNERRKPVCNKQENKTHKVFEVIVDTKNLNKVGYCYLAGLFLHTMAH